MSLGVFCSVVSLAIIQQHLFLYLNQKLTENSLSKTRWRLKDKRQYKKHNINNLGKSNRNPTKTTGVISKLRMLYLQTTNQMNMIYFVLKGTIRIVPQKLTHPLKPIYVRSLYDIDDAYRIMVFLYLILTLSARISSDIQKYHYSMCIIDVI